MTTDRSTAPDEGPGAGAPDGAGKASPPGLKERLATVEHDLILEALRVANGNKARAARALGITERLIGLRVKRRVGPPHPERDDRTSLRT